MDISNIKKINIKKINNELYEEIIDSIIVEIPLKIYINYELYTVLMCTPNEVKELTIGFLFSEGIVTSIDDIISIEEKFNDRVCVILRNDIIVNYESIKAKASGCGSASTQIKFIELGLNKVIKSDYKVAYKSIIKLMKEFNSSSELFKETGGVHSCALCSEEGILIFAEDIGRHNALDKVIGKALMNNISTKNKLLMTTGRISSDLIIKTVKADIPIIVSHSAPTNLALDIAKSTNMTVVGFVRGNRMNIYSGNSVKPN